MEVDINNMKLWKGNRKAEGSNSVPERSMKKKPTLQPTSTSEKRT